MAGWNPTTQVGPTRDGSITDMRFVSVDLARTGERAVVVWEEAVDDHRSVWVRTFADGVWLPELRLSAEDVSAGTPVIALNDAGQAAVAYRVQASSGAAVPGSAVWIRRLDAGSWSAAERLSPEPAGDAALYADDPAVGIDGQGRVGVTWNQSLASDSGRSGVYARRHDGTAWSEPLRLNEGLLPASSSQLAVNPEGEAVVIWIQDTNAYNPGQSGGGPRIPNTWARTFNGAAWSAAPIRIGPDLLAFEGNERPKVAIDTEGRAFAIWEERRIDQARIGAARFDPVLGTWGAPVTVASSTAAANHLSFLSLATDDHGGAFATWTANLPETDEKAGMASRFDGTAGAWSAPSTFTTHGLLVGTRGAMGTAGQGWALYTQPNDSGSAELIAREFRPDGSWGEARVIGNSQVSDAVANPQGVVLVGSTLGWYANTQPLLRAAPGATFFIP